MVENETFSNLSEEAKTSVKEFRQSLGEVIEAVILLTRNEARLAKEEFKQEVISMKKVMILFGFAGMAGVTALLPLLSFCVVGLGRLLNDNYWASSLILFGVLAVTTLILVFIAVDEFKRTKKELKMPRTSEVLNNEMKVIQTRLHKISNSANRRVA